jgi:hypothetical protein
VEIEKNHFNNLSNKKCKKLLLLTLFKKENKFKNKDIIMISKEIILIWKIVCLAHINIIFSVSKATGIT